MNDGRTLATIVPAPFRMPNQETTSRDISQLADQAQEAYEQGRTRECFALTKAWLLADPGNEQAKLLQSAIRADLQQDLQDARGLIEQSGTKEERKKYRRAAEIILLKTLNLDPDNVEAKALLQSARAVPALPNSKPESKQESKIVSHPAAHPTPNQASQAVSETAEDLPFTAAPPLFERKDNKKKSRLKLPYALVVILGLGAVLFSLMKLRPSDPNALAAPVAQAEPANNPNFQPRLGETQPPAAAAPNPGAPGSTPAPIATTQPTTPVAPPVTTASAAAAVPNVTAPAETGRLAVSSPVVAEMYLRGKYLGSTPTTVQLPVGRQTLEYRHGDLRTTATHEIRPNTTTSAAVTFPVTVQINANPWAQVFLDGAQRRSLGQTPLSGVVVPIGSVLVFENPNFPSKSYRISDRDSAIQVNFP